MSPLPCALEGRERRRGREDAQRAAWPAPLRGAEERRVRGRVLRLRGLHPRLISTAPSGQWHEGVLHFAAARTNLTPLRFFRIVKFRSASSPSTQKRGGRAWRSSLSFRLATVQAAFLANPWRCSVASP